MLFQGRRKRNSGADRGGDTQNNVTKCGILLLFTQTFQRLWNGNRCPQQRPHLARESGDIFSPYALPRPGRRVFFDRLNGNFFLGRSVGASIAWFEDRRKQPAFYQKLQSIFAVLSLYHASGLSSVGF